MSGLTNLGEVLALAYATGFGEDSLTAYTNGGTKIANGGAYIGLANIDPAVANPSPEKGFDEIYGALTQSQAGYVRQVATFSQGDYGDDEVDNSVFALNTNTITFGPALEDWPSFRYITVSTVLPTADSKYHVFYFELPQPATVLTGETYTIPVGALRCSFDTLGTNKFNTVNPPNRRYVLDSLLNIVDADSALRAANLARSANLSVTPFVTLSEIGPSHTSDVLIDGTDRVVNAQRIDFDYTAFDTSNERESTVGDTRIFNSADITFSLPAVSTTNIVANYLLLGFLAENSFSIVAAFEIPPTTFNSTNSVRFKAGTISLEFK